MSKEVLSYRGFLLQAMRIGPLEIDEQLKEHQKRIESLQQLIDQSALKLVLFWSIGVSFAVALGVGLFFQHPVAAVAVAATLVVGSFLATKVTWIKEKLRESSRYNKQLTQIETSQSTIVELKQNATAYQHRLEIKEGPGFLSVYRDVILADNYASSLTKMERERCVVLSSEGRGKDIELMDYANLIIELKARGVASMSDSVKFVDKVAAQNKQTAALAFARSVSLVSEPIAEEEQNFTSLVGWNAWLMFNAQGLPSHWEYKEHNEWLLAKSVLMNGYRKNVEAFNQAVEDFKQVGERRQRAR